MASLTQEKLEAMEAEMNRFEAEILGEQEENGAPHRNQAPRFVIGSNTYTSVQARLAAAAGQPIEQQQRTPYSVSAAPPPPPPPSQTSQDSSSNLHLPPPPPPPASMRHMFMPPQLRHRAPPPPRPPAPPMGIAPSGPPPPPPARGPPPHGPPSMLPPPPPPHAAQNPNYNGPPAQFSGYGPGYNPPPNPGPPPAAIRPPKPSPAVISAAPVIIAKPPQVNLAVLNATKKKKKEKKKKEKAAQEGMSKEGEEKASTSEVAASESVAPGIQLNVPMEDIEMERAVTSVGDVAAMAAAMEQQLMQMAPQEPVEKKKKEKKKKFVRTAAGIVWEDQSLGEWDKDDFRIFAGDLGNEVTDEVLSRAFNKYPSFIKAKIVRDKRTNKTRGYGFISFRDPNDFVRAMREMNGKYVGNRPIKLRKSSWKERQIDIVKKKDREKKRLGLR